MISQTGGKIQSGLGVAPVSPHCVLVINIAACKNISNFNQMEVKNTVYIGENVYMTVGGD